ncbi:hypothetical protein WJX72_004048 [[Myrmecia] bisecta]|uniref:tRNA (guanine(37)-N1)-methyltransferase n=1 Tax=[Myrmecia] bisecta TaxID=41462 RepID=A0AAW1PJU6_9CHLO
MAADSQPPVQLDRDAFKQVLRLRALRLPKQHCQQYMKILKGFTLDRPRLRCIVPDGKSSDSRLLLLSESVASPGLSELREDLRSRIQQDKVEVTTYEQPMDYGCWPADYVLKRLLPEGSEVPSSFETIGHIAHLNLRDELLPYKHVIGQVILDKNPNLRTVINKVGTIENEYRVFQMEVVAGDDDLETEVKQHTARFRLNFSQVYWNSRLEREHKRLVDSFRPGQTVIDVMAGIGPFAVPAGQRGCQVYANDLNPRSHHYLQENIKLNKVAKNVQAFQMDGREFIRLACNAPAVGSQAEHAAARDASNASEPCSTSCQSAFPPGFRFDHAIMNLPASAVEFLDAFNGAFQHERWKGPLPMVHCYTFAKADETNAGVQSRVEAFLGGSFEASEPGVQPSQSTFSIHMVRDVAPNKRMLCVSFRLPATVAYGSGGLRPTADRAPNGGGSANGDDENIAKRPRTE